MHAARIAGIGVCKRLDAVNVSISYLPQATLGHGALEVLLCR